MKKWILFLSVSILSFEVMAADGGSVPINPAGPTKAKWARGADGQLQIDFLDGRKAGFFQSFGKVLRFSTAMNQIENTCDLQQRLSRCQMKTELVNYGISLKWIQHPDAKKINAIVSSAPKPSPGTTTTNTSKELKGTSVLHWLSASRQPSLKNMLQADQIVCDNLNWTTQLPKVAGQSIDTSLVDTWTSELMLPNPETSENENATYEASFGVELSKINDTTVQISKVASQANPMSLLAGYYGLKTVSLNYVTTDQRQCQISFDMDIREGFIKAMGGSGTAQSPPKDAPETPVGDLKTISGAGGDFLYELGGLLNPKPQYNSDRIFE